MNRKGCRSRRQFITLRHSPNNCGPGSSVGIATELRLAGPGIELVHCEFTVGKDKFVVISGLSWEWRRSLAVTQKSKINCGGIGRVVWRYSRNDVTDWILLSRYSSCLQHAGWPKWYRTRPVHSVCLHQYGWTNWYRIPVVTPGASGLWSRNTPDKSAGV
jgi:hypothetical protein